jgi:hypothetical protein
MSIQFENDQAILSDTTTVLSATLNSTSSIDIMSTNETREYICFSLQGGTGAPDAWIKFMTSSQDPSGKTGIFLANGTTFVMQHPVMYVGPISAISQTDGPTIHVTWF